jgi:hypothetical protein
MGRLYLGDSEWVEALRRRFGIDKPKWAGLGEWDEIDARIRREHPVGWFFTETVPDFIEDVYNFITAPYYNTRYYIRNRFYRKTHQLRTDCPPGEYWDTDERLLTAMANAIIDYVEIELAYKHMWCGSDEVENAQWRNGRCPELGLKYLEWEMGLDDPELDENSRSDSQANSAREVKKIYDWAKARSTRPDPHAASGWTAYCEKYPHSWKQKAEDVTAEQLLESDAAFQKLREIEKQYETEDEDMLIRIVKIRRSLWT